jgi:hypothetical protein
MKKFSIFALLAIVVATGSAFTAKNAFVQKWEVFGLTPDQVSTSSPTVSGALTYKIADAFNKVSTTAMSSFNTEVSNFNGVQLPGSAIVRCSANDTDQLCGAIITYQDNYQNVSLVNSFVGGDYSLTP